MLLPVLVVPVIVVPVVPVAEVLVPDVRVNPVLAFGTKTPASSWFPEKNACRSASPAEMRLDGSMFKSSRSRDRHVGLRPLPKVSPNRPLPVGTCPPLALCHNSCTDSQSAISPNPSPPTVSAIFRNISPPPVPRKSALPVKHSPITHPAAHTSHAPVAFTQLPDCWVVGPGARNCSGARYHRVPTYVARLESELNSLASPKSASLTFPF
mmetsp:Transcript_8811/g.29370  ORF Transcript_8811/g.29370 Transcript_8811/m.29370 type:complete len:210 (-) Transcript_8811:418-1047(-)